MNVVIIPCFNRPEFLAVCLELIQKAKGAGENLYLFQIDFGYDPELLEVIEKFPLQKEVRFTEEHLFRNKQSYSLFKGYENALTYNPEKVYLIEDDIFIANDFFHWHQKNIGENFASIATRNHNNKTVRHTNNLLRTYTQSEYQSLGVCFHAKSVDRFLPYFTQEFFTDPENYIKRTFPRSRIPSMYCEQDGLIRRIIQDQKLQVVYPHVPRAFHAGYYGKSRGVKPTGILEERINQVKLTAFDGEIMKGDSKPELLVNPIL
jgi:glycosyltransferase involved in cell wall biosynthesis